MAKNYSDFILFDSEKKILLQHRTDDAPRFPGYWSTFGGEIEEEESPKDAVKRECLEELNYPLKNPKLIMTQNYLGGKRYVFMERYNPLKKLKLLEGQGMGWFKLEETKKLKIPDFIREIIDNIEYKY